MIFIYSACIYILIKFQKEKSYFKNTTELRIEQTLPLFVRKFRYFSSSYVCLETVALFGYSKNNYNILVGGVAELYPVIEVFEIV
jgi:hypothetical protein